MRITFDPAKRALTLDKRGLDFALAGLVFGGRHMTRIDDRRDYGEDARRIISMRKANGRERAFFEAGLARS